MSFKGLNMGTLTLYINKEYNNQIILFNRHSKITTTLSNGKKYALNYWMNVKALDDLNNIVKIYKSLETRIELYTDLLPDDIANEIIELYEAYKYETVYSNDDIDNGKDFYRVPIISLYYFAIAYSKYNNLEEDRKLYKKLNNEEAPLISKADVLNTFDQQIKIYNVNTEFRNGCMKLLDEKFSDNSRIKMTSSYKDRYQFTKTVNWISNVDSKTKYDNFLNRINKIKWRYFR